MTDHNINCDAFMAEIDALLDGSLDHHAQSECDSHLATCAACSVLVEELQSIVQEARTLPLPELTRDLWPQIDARLETPVLSLTEHRGVPYHGSRMGWTRLAVAAVALVTVSAGITWTVARSGSGDLTAAREAQLADVRPSTAGGAVAQLLGSGDTAQGNAIGTDTNQTTTSVPRGALAAAEPRRPSRELRTPVIAAANTVRQFSLDTLYGREIAKLRTVAESQLGFLDSTTVAVVRRNLEIIDNAILESRTALARDPNSGFLLEQLDRAYERKVDLLRRLALL